MYKPTSRSRCESRNGRGLEGHQYSVGDEPRPKEPTFPRVPGTPPCLPRPPPCVRGQGLGPELLMLPLGRERNSLNQFQGETLTASATGTVMAQQGGVPRVLL